MVEVEAVDGVFGLQASEPEAAIDRAGVTHDGPHALGCDFATECLPTIHLVIKLFYPGHERLIDVPDQGVQRRWGISPIVLNPTPQERIEPPCFCPQTVSVMYPKPCKQALFVPIPA